MRDRTKTPSGLTVIELMAAAAILAVMLTTAVQMIRVLDSQQRAVQRRALALETAQSLLEQLANAPWDELAPVVDEQLTIPGAVKTHLPGATAHATVIDDPTPVAAKRLSVEVRWTSPGGRGTSPVRLTTWVYRDE